MQVNLIRSPTLLYDYKRLRLMSVPLKWSFRSPLFKDLTPSSSFKKISPSFPPKGTAVVVSAVRILNRAAFSAREHGCDPSPLPFPYIWYSRFVPFQSTVTHSPSSKRVPFSDRAGRPPQPDTYFIDAVGSVGKDCPFCATKRSFVLFYS